LHFPPLSAMPDLLLPPSPQERTRFVFFPPPPYKHRRLPPFSKTSSLVPRIPLLLRKIYPCFRSFPIFTGERVSPRRVAAYTLPLIERSRRGHLSPPFVLRRDFLVSLPSYVAVPLLSSLNRSGFFFFFFFFFFLREDNVQGPSSVFLARHLPPLFGLVAPGLSVPSLLFSRSSPFLPFPGEDEQLMAGIFHSTSPSSFFPAFVTATVLFFFASQQRSPPPAWNRFKDFPRRPAPPLRSGFSPPSTQLRVPFSLGFFSFWKCETTFFIHEAALFFLLHHHNFPSPSLIGERLVILSTPFSFLRAVRLSFPFSPLTLFHFKLAESPPSLHGVLSQTAAGL